MTETPQAAAGWYPDGSAYRYWDGAAWTEHVHPGYEEQPRAAVVPPHMAAGPATAGAPVAPGHGSTPDAPVAPRRDASEFRRIWLAVSAVGVVLLLLVVVFAVLSTSDDSAAPPADTVAPPSGAVSAVAVDRSATDATTSPITYGAAPAVVASVAGCTDARDPQRSAASAPQTYQRITCTVGTATVQVDTYPSAEDQGAAESTLLAYIGTGAYASGEGWTAREASMSSDETARTFVEALGGSVKGA